MEIVQVHSIENNGNNVEVFQRNQYNIVRRNSKFVVYSTWT